MRILYNPHAPLKNNETLLLRRGVLYTESLNARARRFTLINLFTNHRYDKTNLINRLIFKARWADEQLAEKYINTANTLLARAKAEAPLLSKYRFIRWIKGTPLVNIADLERRIAQARPKLHEPAARDTQTLRQKALDSLTLSLEEVRNTLLKAQMDCPEMEATHVSMLKKWIIVAEQRDRIIETYDREKKLRGEGFLFRYDPAGLYFHGERDLVGEQDPAIAIYKGLEDYAVIYKKICSDSDDRSDFFKNTFRGGNACFEGNHKEVIEWNDKRFGASYDLVIELDSKKSYFANLAALETVFEAHVFRRYFQFHHGLQYDEQWTSHRDIKAQYFNLGRATTTMKQYREKHANKEKLEAFIRGEKILPYKCSDSTLTEETLKDRLDSYYAIVFGE